MRRTIQDLVASVDPNVKIEPEVEDVCTFLSAFPLIDYCYSYYFPLLTSLSTRSQTLHAVWPSTVEGIHSRSVIFSFTSVRLFGFFFFSCNASCFVERNHNIRIPGFASDDARIHLSQTSLAPSAPAAASKKTAQGQHMTLRSQRLAQVAQAKREAKLI